MWDLIVSVPDHCLSFYFSRYIANNYQCQKLQRVITLVKVLRNPPKSKSDNLHLIPNPFRETSPCKNDLANPVLIASFARLAK